MEDQKRYISAQELFVDSFKLAKQIYDSGFRPDFIVALWRGGTPTGIAIQEFMAYHGIHSDHIAARTSAYEGIGKIGKQIRVHGLGYLIKRVNAENSILIVDDVFDSGHSIEELLKSLQMKTRRNMPETIKIATIFYKPGNKKTDFGPDYYLEETDQWLVFPHELEGLTKEEIVKNKPSEIADLLD